MKREREKEREREREREIFRSLHVFKEVVRQMQCIKKLLENITDYSKLYLKIIQKN